MFGVLSCGCQLYLRCVHICTYSLAVLDNSYINGYVLGSSKSCIFFYVMKINFVLREVTSHTSDAILHCCAFSQSYQALPFVNHAESKSLSDPPIAALLSEKSTLLTYVQNTHHGARGLGMA
jgi:hypothetical protein